LKYIKIAMSLILISTLLFGLAACKTNSASAGTINGENMTLEMFKLFLFDVKQSYEQSGSTQAPSNNWNIEKDGKKLSDVAKDQALNQEAEYYLIRQQAKAKGITIEAQDKTEINTIKNDRIQKLGDNDKFQNALSVSGITEATYDEMLEMQVYRKKLQEKLAKEDKNFQLTDEEIKDYYIKNYIKAEHILFMTVDAQQKPLAQDKIDAAKKSADDVLAKIKAGGNFEELMNKYSVDPGLKDAPTGYIFTKGEMVPEFENVVFTLKEGEVPDIVKSSYGYHIIKRVKFSFDAKEFEQKKDAVKNKILLERFDALVKGQWETAANLQRNDDAIKAVDITNLAKK